MPRPDARSAGRAGSCRISIARRGIESSERVDRRRWVVERTHAWFDCFHRLPICYERRADIYEAFPSLTASLITLNQIKRFY